MSYFVNGIKLSDKIEERYVCNTKAAINRVFIGQSDVMRQDAIDMLGKWGSITVTFIPLNGKPWRIKTYGCHRG